MHFTAIPEIFGQSNRGPVFTAGHLIFTAILAKGHVCTQVKTRDVVKVLI